MGKFAKIDVGRHRGIANKYKISIKPSTKQLPTLILFADGEEVRRMPDFIDPLYKGKGVKKVPLSLKAIEETLELEKYSAPPKVEKEKKEKKKRKGNFKKSSK